MQMFEYLKEPMPVVSRLIRKYIQLENIPAGDLGMLTHLLIK